MDDQKIDLRVRKTKKAIRYAVTRLLSVKGYDEITVREIIELSEINHKTFYRYYRCVLDVVEEIENDVVKTFESFLYDVDLVDSLKKPVVILERLNSVFDSDKELYANLLSARKNIDLMSKVNKSIKETAKRIVTEQKGFEENCSDLGLEYAISGRISVYNKWYLSDRSESIEEISEIIGIMYNRGIAGLLEENKLKRVKQQYN